MAKTLIGNIKGKDGRGIASISKTGTTGSVDTYTIRYTDNTTSTFTVNNADSIAIQRQIVPSAAVESSATASQAYTAGQYVVVNGVLRKVKSAIAKGNAISDSNSTATTVSGELAGNKPVVLYDNASGTNGNITLSESAAKFDYIEIFGGKLDNGYGGYTSVKVMNPNGKKFTMSQMNYISADSGYIQVVGYMARINGTTIEREFGGYFAVDGTNSIINYDANDKKFLIYRVIGYRK